jgi:outer membrane immunogenic protein
MVLKARPALAPVYNWTDWFVGVNAGGAWGNSDLNTVPTNGIFAASGFPGTQAGILANQITNVKPTGAIAGAQVGYNWQVSNWLLGVEADANYLGLRRSFGIGPTALNSVAQHFPQTVLFRPTI